MVPKKSDKSIKQASGDNKGLTGDGIYSLSVYWAEIDLIF